jgi:hypothetical protein
MSDAENHSVCSLQPTDVVAESESARVRRRFCRIVETLVLDAAWRSVHAPSREAPHEA